MSATDAFENGMLSLIFENANFANVGDATGLRGSTAAGVFFVSLHTATPGETGTQATNETVYSNYVRTDGSIVRGTTNWTVALGIADNDTAITYALCGATGATVTFFGIGSTSTGAGNLNLYGAITSPASGLIVNAGVTPSFAAGALDNTLD